jgi:hypothetical protein
MGRKAYIADVADAIAQTTPGITNVVKGTEDGDLHLCFTPSNGLPIEMSLLSLGESLILPVMACMAAALLERLAESMAYHTNNT